MPSCRLTSRLVALFLILATVSAAWAQTAAAPESPADPVLEAALLAATNEARARHGLDPLRSDAGLTRAARAHAAENAARGVLDHGSPNPRLDTPAERVAAAGVALVEVGENLARIPGGAVAERAVEGWLNSPPHRRNLLDPSYTHVGFGAAEGPGGRYLTQLFGARPIERHRAVAHAVVEEVRRWVLEVRGPPGLDVMVFADGRPVAPARLGPNGARIAVPVQRAGGARLAIGVARRGDAYLRTDAGRLVDGAGWVRDGEPVAEGAYIAAASLDQRTRTAVEVVLAYDAPQEPLQLFVDGRHLPGAVAEGGTLRALLPPAESPRVLAVGLANGDGTARMVERFTLLPGDPPVLRPGAAAPGTR